MTANETVPRQSVVPAVVSPPSELLIAGITVSVKAVPKPVGDNDEPVYGCFKNDKYTIELDLEASLANQQHTLVHECLHAMFFLCSTHGILKNMADGEVNYRANWEEMLVASMDTGLLTLIRDNPALGEYLRAR